MGDSKAGIWPFTFPILLGFIPVSTMLADLTGYKPLFRVSEPVCRTVEVSKSR